MTNTKSTKHTKQSYAPSMVAQLRSLIPNRPLSFTEAAQLAEIQAARLLKLSDCYGPPVPESVITDLPRISVKQLASLSGAGLTTWSEGKWQIAINGAEPFTRQRFTLAHELKHVLDASCDDVIYKQLPVGQSRTTHIEAICDHFAASLLMPRPWVKQFWADGIQDVRTLAWQFQVSPQAMLIRLQVIGPVQPLPRCHTLYRLGSAAVYGTGRVRPSRQQPPAARFHRTSQLLVAAASAAYI